MYAQQLGWLHTIPDEQKATRGQQLKAQGEPLRLPPVEWTHVLDWWEEIGIGRELNWTELDAWNRATGTDATHFELRALLDMHNSYMIQRTKTAPALSPPYDPRTEEEKNEALNKSFVNVFSRLPRAK